MNNRFGIKDFVTIVLLVVVLLAVLLSMVQKTRMELALDGTRAKLSEIEQQTMQLQRIVEKGFSERPTVVVAAGGEAAS